MAVSLESWLSANEKEVRCLHATSWLAPVSGNWGGGFDVAKAHCVTEEFLAALDHLGIAYYMAYGTCLALFRDGDLFAWDCDVDVCASYRDFSKIKFLLTPYLHYCGFELIDLSMANLDSEMARSANARHSAKRFLFRKDGQMIDLAIQVWMPPTDPFVWRGLTVQLPRFTELYVRQCYGPRWRIPDNRGGVHIDQYQETPHDGRLTHAIPWVGSAYWERVKNLAS